MKHNLDTLSRPDLPLSREQLDTLVRFTNAVGEDRAAAQYGFNECDFLAGAMCAFFAFGHNGLFPARWLFAPASGKNVFDHLLSTLEEKLDDFERRITDLEEEPTDE